MPRQWRSPPNGDDHGITKRANAMDWDMRVQQYFDHLRLSCARWTTAGCGGRLILMDFGIVLAIQVLERTPATLQALLGGLAEPWVRGNEGPETFSPFDVLGHLIDGEETDWIPRARIILSRDPDARFEPYDRFRHRARNAGRPLGSLLAEFAELRRANVVQLRAWKLTSAELDLRAEHPSLGAVTLRQLLASCVVHDLGHVAQVARVMAKQYRADAGPWEAYLPVLTDRPVPRS